MGALKDILAGSPRVKVPRRDPRADDLRGAYRGIVQREAGGRVQNNGGAQTPWDARRRRRM